MFAFIPLKPELIYCAPVEDRVVYAILVDNDEIFDQFGGAVSMRLLGIHKADCVFIHRATWEQMDDVTQKVVMYHEVAHHALGHTEADATHPSMILQREIEVDYHVAMHVGYEVYLTALKKTFEQSIQRRKKWGVLPTWRSVNLWLVFYIRATKLRESMA